MSNLINMSHSRASVMQNCGKQYFYRYVLRVEPKIFSSNLGFGSSIHAGIASHLTGKAMGFEIDPKPVFQMAWDNFNKKPVSFGSTWTKDELTATGLRLLELFVEDWPERRLSVVLDKNGIPIIERSLKVRLPGGVIYQCIIDMLVEDEDKNIYVIDAKTPSQKEFDGFTSLSAQLTGAQVTLNANADALGIKSQIAGLGFYDLVKRKIPTRKGATGPEIHVSEFTKPRSGQDVADWAQEIAYVANDIRNKRYFRRSMDAYNSPCQMCDFFDICTGKAEITDYATREPFVKSA